MGDLPDAERDALHAVQALVALNRHMRHTGGDKILADLVQDGCAAAARVLAYLRDLQGAGDGASTAYPARLGPWRDWCPPRGDILGQRGGSAYRRVDPGGTMPRWQPHHGDPGE